jgi:hypothetical protein
LQYVRRQAERLNSDIRRERRLGYFGTVFAASAGFFVAIAPFSAQVPTAMVLVIQLTVLLSLLGCGYIAFEGQRRSKQQLAVEHEQVMKSLDAYRAALERRRNHYATAWRWSLWPAIPGVVLVLGGGVLFDDRPHKWLRLSLAALVCALALLAAVWISFRKSEGFQRELAALYTLDESEPSS